MENPDNSNPNPNNYITNINNYVIDNGNNNVKPFSFQHASRNPSATTATGPQVTMLFGNWDDSAAEASSISIFKGLCHRRAYSDGNYLNTASDDDGGLSGYPGNGVSTSSFFEEMVPEEDEFVSAFLNENYDGFRQLMGHDEGGSGGGGKPKKSSRISRRTNLPEELAQIWADDPKRVKRILSNRQSAARSKERKTRYTSELERRIHFLQSESTNLYAKITIYERETKGLSTENVELKLRLQVMEEQAGLRDAINEALRHEVHTLKITNAELKNPSEQSSSGGGRASPTTLTLQSPMHFNPLTSPSTLQLPAHFSPLTSPSIIQPPAHFSQLNSPSTLPSSAYFSPLTSTSTIQSSAHFSTLTSPPMVQMRPLTLPSIVQTVLFTKPVSPSVSLTRTHFLLSPRPSVYAVAPLPPLHRSRSRSSLISRRFRQPNSVPPTEQNDSLGSRTRGLNLVKAEGAPVSGSGSGSVAP